MAYATKYITARIEWCRRQSTQVCAPLESADWRAEAEGLQDALLHRDHTTQYQQGSPSVFERYVLGLPDGRAVLRTAAVHQHVAPPVHQAGAERKASSYRMGDVSTRRMLGLYEARQKYIGECVGSWSLASLLENKKIMRECGFSLENMFEVDDGSCLSMNGRRISWVPSTTPPLVESIRQHFSFAFLPRPRTWALFLNRR